MHSEKNITKIAGSPRGRVNSSSISENSGNTGSATTDYLRKVATKTHRWRGIRRVGGALVLVIAARWGPHVREGIATSWLTFLAPVFWVAVFCLGCLLYKHDRDNEWDRVEAKAKARNPETSVRGLIDVFRIYARTTRHAFYLSVVAALGFYAACETIVLTIVEERPTRFAFVPVLDMIAAALIAFWAYKIGKNYRPGGVIIEHAADVASVAAHPQTPAGESEARARELTRKLESERPHWFQK